MMNRRLIGFAEQLASIANHPRVLVRRGGPPHGPARVRSCTGCSVPVRIADDPALDMAIEAGDLLGLPVVVFFSIIPNYPHANLRHYHFMQQGLRDVAEDAAARGVGFVVRGVIPAILSKLSSKRSAPPC